MSQHIFKTTYEGYPVTVMMGWDRPLQDYFLTITMEPTMESSSVNEMCGCGHKCWDNTGLDQPQIVYDSGIDDASKGEGLDYYKTTLLELGIEVPSVMFKHVHHDLGFNVGNRICKYATDGSFTDTNVQLPGDL